MDRTPTMMGSVELAETLGITYRQLHHWVSTGVAKPASQVRGSGNAWEFAPAEVARLQQGVELIRAGCKVLGISFSLPPRRRTEGQPHA